VNQRRAELTSLFVAGSGGDVERWNSAGGPHVMVGRDGHQRVSTSFSRMVSYSEDGVTPRVVRVGTHALRPSKSTLCSRLSQHKGHTDGSKPAVAPPGVDLPLTRRHRAAGLGQLAGGDSRLLVGGKKTAPPMCERAEYPSGVRRQPTYRRQCRSFVRRTNPPGPESDRGGLKRARSRC